MSILGAMYSAVSGLFANSNALGIISDNIANANTIGYKETSTNFSTLVTQSGSPSLYSPGGVTSSPYRNIDQQGVLQASSSPTDLAISGGGFFIVNNNSNSSNGTYSFTRAGSFRVDANGNLKNAAGLYLQGQPLTTAQAQAIANGSLSQFNATSLTTLQTVNVNGIGGTATPTSTVSILGANLPASDTASSPARAMTVPVFDSQGIEHDMTLNFARATSTENFNIAGMAAGQTYTFSYPGGSVTTGATAGNALSDVVAALTGVLPAGYTATVASGQLQIANSSGVSLTGDTLTAATGSQTITAGNAGTPIANTWTVSASIPNAGATSVTLSGNAVAFNADGTLNTAGTTFNSLSVAWDPSVTGGTSPQSISFDLGTNGTATGLAQLGSNYDSGQISQDGVKFGNFTGVSVDQNGIVTANFDNGMHRAIYIVPLATFSNPDGLDPATGNTYMQTTTSGTPQLRQAGIGTAGQIAPSELEDSTVDIATEFSNLIVTQRAYEANSKIITTSDQMLQALMSVKQ